MWTSAVLFWLCFFINFLFLFNFALLILPFQLIYFFIIFIFNQAIIYLFIHYTFLIIVLFTFHHIPRQTMLQLRIVKVDYYVSNELINGLDALYSDFRGTDITRMPVIRIFGITNEGKKACLHVHGFLPYFYVLFKEDNVTEKEVFVQQFVTELDAKINVANKSRTNQRWKEITSIHNIEIVKAINFYGYYQSTQQFLKIYFYEPSSIKKACDLLQNGMILNKKMSVFESHIPYILKFFIDYNLFGMNFINLESFKSRQCNLFCNQDLGPKNETIEKMTSCEIEIDCRVEDILNVKENLKEVSANPGIRSIWEEERKRREFDGFSESITPTMSQERCTYFESEFEKQAILKLRQCLETNSQKSSQELPSSYNSQNQLTRLSQLIKEKSQDIGSSFNEDDLVNLVMKLAEENDQSLEDYLENQFADDLISLELSQTFVDVFNESTSSSDYQISSAQVQNSQKSNSECDSQAYPLSQLVEEREEEEEKKKDAMDDFELDWSLLDSNVIPQLDGSFDVNRYKKRSKRETKYRFSPLPINITRPQQEKLTFDAFSNILNSVKARNNPQTSKVKENNIKPPIRLKKLNLNIESSQERIVRCINGHVVLVKRSIIPQLGQIGKEVLQLDPIKDTVVDKFSIDTKSKKGKNVKPLQIINSSNLTKGKLKKVDVEDNSKKVKKIKTSEQCKEEELNLEVSLKLKESLISTQPMSSSMINQSFVSHEVEMKDALATESTTSLDINRSEDKINNEAFLSTNDLIIPSPIELEKSHLYSNFEHVSFISSDILKGSSQNSQNKKNEVGLNESTSSVFSFYQFGEASSVDINTQKSFSSDDGPNFEERQSTPQSSHSNRKKFHSSHCPFTEQNHSNILGPIPENEESILPPKSSFLKSSQETGNTNNSDAFINKTYLKRRSFDSLIVGVTQKDTFNFGLCSLDEQNKERLCYSSHEFQFLTSMNIEVLAEARSNKNSDPMIDPIKAVFYGIGNDVPTVSSNSQVSAAGKPLSIGIIVIEEDIQHLNGISDSICIPIQRKLLARCGFARDKIMVTYANDEIDLFTKLIEIVKENDPDILFGYEIEFGSWSYLLQRAEALNINIATGLSRINDERYCNSTSEYDLDFKTGLQVPGRIVLNLWRIIRKEVTLNMYSYENVHFHVLHERIPSYSCQNLSNWFDDLRNINRWRVIEYFLIRTEGCHRIIEKLNIISQTSELARLFGIQFFEVFSRGSQFRVESMLLRIAKLSNYVMISHTNVERARMKAAEALPLVMEPESKLYTDPVVVLDFQSLYPSIMIAYNYCYSTCLGRVTHLPSNEPFEFGCSSLYISSQHLKRNLDNINIAPNGVGFFKQNVRKGVLPSMLEEILNTRIMVKNSIKEHSKRPNPSKRLLRLLNARQLGLKLIANVTTGYTNANFSGRMPCIDIADAIISKGRETLMRAIELVNNNNHKWGGRVIYGDTDSLFILFENTSREDAFRKGQEIVEAVNKVNLYPIKLKFEKVYQPCLLQSKKRYVGFMYESEDQAEPILEAKGIELIRRDTCSAASKILEKSLKILFTIQDIENGVKPYVIKQFQKILQGRISCLQDFIFAREFRGFDKYRPNACVPALKIARKLQEINPKGVPKQGERVPYVIVNGTPDQPLIQLVRQPYDLIKNSYLQLNSCYYIERVIIPTLNRVFEMLGYNVMDWYKEMFKKVTYQRALFIKAKQDSNSLATLHKYFSPRQCPVCENKTVTNEICDDCLKDSQTSVIVISEKIKYLETKFNATVKMCQSCNGNNDTIQECNSIECSNLFRYNQAKLDLNNINYLNHLLNKFTIS